MDDWCELLRLSVDLGAQPSLMFPDIWLFICHGNNQYLGNIYLNNNNENPKTWLCVYKIDCWPLNTNTSIISWSNKYMYDMFMKLL